jgi:hypothetical protein
VSTTSKLQDLEALTGMSLEEILEEGTFDSVCEGICVTPSCDYTATVEPDQDRGWCPHCEKNTVKSALILAGMI